MGNITLSSGQLWRSGAVLILVDAALIAALVGRIKPGVFRDLKWALAGAAAFFWSAFAIVLVQVFWEDYYRYFYPAWFHSLGMLLWVPALFGALALAFHWLALRMPGHPILGFCLLGGVEAVVEHLWGIYGFKIMTIPALHGAGIAPVLAFAFPEYIFYWCIVIGIAAVVYTGWRRWLRPPLNNAQVG
jgi:hypothetical protein